MPALRTPAWLPIAGIFVVAAGALGWLLFVFPGEQRGLAMLGSAWPAEAATTTAAARPHVTRFADVGGQRTLDEVRRLPASAWHAPEGTGSLWFDDPVALWLRVEWRNPTGRAVNGILTMGDYFLDRADAWLGDGDDADGGEREDSAWRHDRSGEKVAGREKAIGGREVAFAVDVPARGGRVAYLRLQNRFLIRLHPEWWPDARAFHVAQSRQWLAEGIYFGGLLALLGYNLALWVRLRPRDIGCYVLYLGTLLVFVFLARAQPAMLGWALGSPGLETALVVATAGTGVFLIQFARVFLELGKCLPRGDRVARGLQGVLLLLAVGALSIPWTTYSLWMTCAAATIAVTHLVLPVLAAGAWRAGRRQARFFLLAFGCLFLGTLGLVGVWFNFDAPRDGGMMALMLGSALEMLLLSLAVADRFAQTQRRLVEETEQRRAIQEAYADDLEVEVRERTAELEAANGDKDRMLIALGHDLRNPLAALTQRAEQLRNKHRGPPGAPGGPVPEATRATMMEALVGFTGEAAGAGRQMLLLIEDIVLWARLRTGARPIASALAATGIVTPVVALHRSQAERRGVALTADVPEVLRVQTDLVLAQTMVRNLVGNAVKFARSRVAVTARAVDAGAGVGGVCITVRDDGAGLPPAVRARLRGLGDADGEGGMGLRLIREIGAALGATIVASTPDDGGTEISITLPTVPALTT